MNNVAHTLSAQLVYLVYGESEQYVFEAKFSILSALRYTTRPLKILLYTDQPQNFEGWPVENVILDQATLDAWTGTRGYLHRRKACAVLDALGRADCSVFVDTDTFFVADPHRLFERVRASKWLVDKIEAKWGDCADLPIYSLLADIVSSKYGSDDSMLLINSGVLGFDARNASLPLHAIDLIDEFVEQAPGIHIIEQFAFGVSAASLGRPAVSTDIIRHYYSERRYWTEIIKCFFTRHSQAFSPALPDEISGVPQAKCKPRWGRRAILKLLSFGLSKKESRAFRLAYYALHLPEAPYSAASRLAYCRMLLAKHPDYLNGLQTRCVSARARMVFSQIDIDTLVKALSVKKI